MAQLITLTTDFGITSPYVAVMKGVILSINPAARILDLTSRDPAAGPAARELLPRDGGAVLSRRARSTSASSIRASAPSGPRSTSKSAGSASSARTMASSRDCSASCGGCRVVRRLDRTAILAAAGLRHVPRPRHLRAGRGAPEPRASTRPNSGRYIANPVELPIGSAVTFGKQWQGEVQFVDDFGNLITNIPACKLKSLPVKVSVGGSRAGGAALGADVLGGRSGGTRVPLQQRRVLRDRRGERQRGAAAGC